MAAHLVVVIDVDDMSQTELQNRYQHDNGRHKNIRGVRELLKRVMSGAAPGTIQTQLCANASVKASATVTCVYASAVDGTDDITIAGSTLSVEAAPSGESQWDSGSSNATMADNLAAAINAHSTISQLVSAASDGVDTVTITALLPGDIYNQIDLAETGNGMTLSGANLAGGSGLDSSTVNSYAFGT